MAHPEQIILPVMGISAIGVTGLTLFEVKKLLSEAYPSVSLTMGETTYDVTEAFSSLGAAGATLAVALLFWGALFPAKRAAQAITLAR